MFTRASWLLFLILPLALACGDEVEPGSLGTPCTNTFDCLGDLVCFGTQSRGPECMTPCDAETRICESGDVCLADTNGVRVCYAGGETDPGGFCSNSGDCSSGHVCVDSGVGDPQCLQACDTRASLCTEGNTCTVLDEEPAGYCTASGT